MTNSSTHIRKAHLDDATAIAHIHVICWQQSYKGIVDQTYLDELRPEMRITMRQQILAEESLTHSFVALVDDQIVGFCDVGPYRDGFHPCQASPSTEEKTPDKQIGEIYAIYLLADFQHQGIGTRLWKIGCQTLEDAGYKSVKFWTLKENHAACAFYEKQGAHQILALDKKIGERLYPLYPSLCYYVRLAPSIYA